MLEAGWRASFSNFPREINRRSYLNPTPTCAVAKFYSQAETIHSFHHLWRGGGSMKLKHPAVFSLTPICHCNLNRGKGRHTERKTKRNGWLKLSEGRSFLILVGRREGEVTEVDQMISGDTKREGTQWNRERMKAYKQWTKHPVIEIDDKKPFVSKSWPSAGQDRAERQEAKETEIARKPLQQTFTGVFCGTCLPLWFHSRWASRSTQGSTCSELSWFSIY